MTRAPFAVLVRISARKKDEYRIYPAGRSLPTGSLRELSRIAEILDLIWLEGETPLRVERRGIDGERLLLWEHQGLRGGLADEHPSARGVRSATIRSGSAGEKEGQHEQQAGTDRADRRRRRG